MESIYLKYKNGYSESPDKAISFYHHNALFFNNISGFTNEHEFRLFMEVYLECVNALVIRNQYKNAADALRLLPVIEKAIDDLKIDRAGFYLYIRLLFQKASALFYLNDIDQALKLFKRISAYEPENDLAKEWIKHCKLKILNRFVFVTIGLALISLLLQALLKGAPYIRLREILSVVVYASVIAGVGLIFYIQSRSNKRTA